MASPTRVPGLCRRGWHVLLGRHGKTYVRFATRFRDANGTFLYRIGPAPDDSSCVTIWDYESKGVAWTCSLCGRSIIGLERPAPP